MEDFNIILIRWSKSLVSQIDTLLKKGKKVYLIALSRKMPRFFHWLKFQDTEEIRPLLEILKNENVILISEYAIPMLYALSSEDDKARMEAIVVDDAIIFGLTINRVCLEWLGYTGKKPGISALVRLDGDSLFPALEDSWTADIPRQQLNILCNTIENISQRLMSTSLPIDMEFPLIWASKSFEDMKNDLEGSDFDGVNCYSVFSGNENNTKESFSILFDKSKFWPNNNDFVKIRLFPKEDCTLIETIGPNEIGRHQLSDMYFFSDEDYNQLWNLVLISITKGSFIENHPEGILGFNKDLLTYCVYTRIFSTLAVWLNYLVSLAFFIRNLNALSLDDVSLSVNNDDICLLLGDIVTENVTFELNKIITQAIQTDNASIDVALPIYASPESVKEQYDRLVATVVTPGKSIELNLDEIYKISHFSGPINRVETISMIGHHTIGETFESLSQKLYKFFFEDDTREMKVHAWIDRRIDECRVAPKYELVTGSDGKKYFRRFFLAGSNPIR